MTRTARTCILWLACIAVCAGAAADSARRIRFEDIEGAKRWDRAAGVWELAHGGPLQLFRDGSCLRSEPCDVRLQANAVPVPLAQFNTLHHDVTFTCVLELAQSNGGILMLQLCRPDRTVAGKSLAAFGADGSLAVVCHVPYGLGDNVPLTLRAAATGAVTVRRVMLFRSFEQLFGADTPFPIQGMAWHKFGANGTLSPHFEPGNCRHHKTGEWRGLCPTDVRDGIQVGVLNKSYFPLLCAGLGEQAGVPLPVRGPGGARLCWRGVGEYTLPVITDGVPKRAYKNERVGAPDGWHDTELALDPSFLDSSGNGVWSGAREYDWQCGTTLVTNFGEGLIDYLAVLPQNRVALPPGTARIVGLRFRNIAGEWTPFTMPVPDAATAIGLTFQATRQTALWCETPAGWQPLGTIPGAAAPNCLHVEPHSLTLTRAQP